ncbi:hypothetical protein ZHAS_00002020 [Anopheles sinensis]|uniref:DM10 domain-containing protein n=1 Tax=Anopheles sinensis TaxID=74873 RepID=A0A084VBQ0_ANOSI|nr:hypothetical protein ZHAS_00002020 [Anopheles sinensis]
MEGLPKLPGNDFANRLRQKHHVPQSFKYINGYPIPVRPECGLGGERLHEDSIQFSEVSAGGNDTVLYDPILTYGRVHHLPVKPYRPHFVLYDQKTLKFSAFFRQAVPESPHETFRIRYVNILYFLEDDTLTVLEPAIENCGYPQGRLVRRGRKLKNAERGEFYCWKDLNIGIDVEMHGYVFHITDCDAYTKEFLLSNGIELNEIELLPPDPAMNERSISQRQSFRHHKMYPVPDDKLRKYLEYQGKVLHFDCVLDERDREGGELMTYKLFYYLEDDTVSIKELKENQEGRDYFPMLLRKQKLPKNWKENPEKVKLNLPPFSSVTSIDFLEKLTTLSLADGTISIMESSIDNSGIRGGRFLSPRKIWLPGCDPNEPDYYTAKDLYIGATIVVFSHRFKIVSADLYVYRYMQAHPEMFSSQTIESVRNYMLAEGHLKEDLQQATDEAYRKIAPEGPEGEPLDEVQKRLSGFKVDDARAGMPPKLVCSGGSPMPQHEKPYVAGDQVEHPCPHPTIPDEEIRKAYHTNEPEELAIQSYHVPENYPSSPSPPRSPLLDAQGGGKKTVRFQDDC